MSITVGKWGGLLIFIVALWMLSKAAPGLVNTIADAIGGGVGVFIAFVGRLFRAVFGGLVGG